MNEHAQILEYSQMENEIDQTGNKKKITRRRRRNVDYGTQSRRLGNANFMSCFKPITNQFIGFFFLPSEFPFFLSLGLVVGGLA